jgi:hypothetical protein
MGSVRVPGATHLVMSRLPRQSSVKDIPRFGGSGMVFFLVGKRKFQGPCSREHTLRTLCVRVFKHPGLCYKLCSAICYTLNSERSPSFL